MMIQLSNVALHEGREIWTAISNDWIVSDEQWFVGIDEYVFNNSVISAWHIKTGNDT